MTHRKLKDKVQDLDARITHIETIYQQQHQDLQRNLGAIQHKLNTQSRAIDRLLQYAAATTGLEAFEPNPEYPKGDPEYPDGDPDSPAEGDQEPIVTWSD